MAEVGKMQALALSESAGCSHVQSSASLVRRRQEIAEPAQADISDSNQHHWVGAAKEGDIEVNLQKLARVALRHGRYTTYKQLQKRLKSIEGPPSKRDQEAKRRNARLRRLLTSRARTARNFAAQTGSQDLETPRDTVKASTLDDLFDVSDLQGICFSGHRGPRLWDPPAQLPSAQFLQRPATSHGDMPRQNSTDEPRAITPNSRNDDCFERGPDSYSSGDEEEKQTKEAKRLVSSPGRRQTVRPKTSLSPPRRAHKRLDLTPQKPGQRVIAVLPQKQQLKQILYERFQGFDRKADSPRTIYAEYCQKQRLLPEPLGLSETESRALNLSHFGIGDAHAGAMAQGLRNMQGLRTLDLRENRLGDSAITVLLQNTAHLKLRKLDLSHSCVSRGAAKALGALLRESTSLRVVILNKVRFAGDSFERICRALRTPTCTLRFLHLCDTGMGHTLATAETLGKMLSQNKSLVALNIAWNNISGGGAEALAQGIRANRTLHTLDARWNMLGTAATALGAALAKNRVLSHLDLSYNHITADQCKELAQGLNLNHSLLGLHMAGNAYKVSPAGFLIPRKYAVLDSTNAHKALVGQTTDTICNAELRHDPKAGLKRRAALQREKAAKEAEDRAYNKAHDPFATDSGPRRRGRLAIHGGQQQPPGVSPFGEDAQTAHERLAAATSAVTGHKTTASEASTDSPVSEHPHGSSSGRVISFRSAIVAVTTRNRNKRHLPNLLDVVRLKREQDKKKKTPHLDNSEPECEHCWICARWREVRVDFVDFAAAEEAALASAAEELRRQEEREEIRRQIENNPFKQRVVAQKTAPKPKTNFKPRHIEMYLSIDGFRRPRKLAYVDGDFKYEAHVMLPPGRCEFFFTVDGEMNRVLASNMHAAEASPEARHAFELLIKRKQDSKDGDTIPLPWRLKDKNRQPHKQRYSPNGPLRLHSFAILERLEKTLPDTIRAIPRRQNTRAIPRRRQSFLQEDGVFAALGKESTEDTVKAFKADCSHAKFQRVVKDKDERNNMLSALQENYSILRVVYQLFCANHTGLSVTSVSWHSFFEFCQMCLIVDDKLDQKDLENMFVAANVNDASRDQGVDMTGRKLNPDRDLCRYEFVEIVGRIAIKKFFQRGLVDSPADAVRRLVETHFLPYLDIEAPQVFRERFLFNQPVDLIFQHFLPVMQRLFRRAADSHLNRKSKRMTFTAWRNLITKSGIFSNAACTERESRIAYRLSMKYVEDEMKSDEHLSVGFLEFLEALARLAFLSDQASLAHLVKRFSQIFDAQSRLEASFKKTNDNTNAAAAMKGQARTVSPAEEDANKKANNTETKPLPSPEKIRDESTKTALSAFPEPQSSRSALRQSTLSEGELEALLREDPDAEDSSLDSSSEDDNEEDENGRGAGCGQDKGFGVVHLNPTSGFPLKLSLLLRVLIWHPLIYDRANLKAITSEKRHQELLSRRGSLRITASSHLH